MENLINRIEKPVDTTGTYVGEDGLLYCFTCGTARQTKINVFGKERVVTCLCRCEAEKRDAVERRAIADAIELNRLKCFRHKRQHTYTFENDDGGKPNLTRFCKRYVENFGKNFKQGKGILLTGSYGTGKSYMAACIANALIDSGKRVLYTDFPTLCMNLGNEFTGEKAENLNLLNSYSLLVLDDLGVERETPSMVENVYSVINGRYESGKPMIITTNLTIEELRNTKSQSLARIYDRVLERSYVISLDGESRRQANTDRLQQEAIEIMKF